MEKGYQVVFYRTARGESPVDHFLDELDPRMRAKVLKWLVLLSEDGPNLPRPYADVLEGPVRELGVGLGRLEARLLYFFHGRRVIVVSHGFLKKSRAVDRGEIDRALRARSDWLLRHGGGT